MSRSSLSDTSTKSSVSDTIWTAISIIFFLIALAVSSAFYINIYYAAPKEIFPGATVFIVLYLAYKITRSLSLKKNP
jgi:hypothetical protein